MSMIERMRSDKGFIAAIDQSAGSTPKALSLYGIPENEYSSNAEMFDLVHVMRVRIMTNPSFNSESILGTILFEEPMTRNVEDQPSSQYLWRQKQILSFLKVDKGLEEENDGVRLMKAIPDLDELLPRAKSLDVFGTKMRSVINGANAAGIQSIVEQQFDIARQILNHGLVPIIEPEININSPEKSECEELLKPSLHEHLDALEGDLPVMFKLTLPDEANFYQEFCTHPKVLRVAALSGGYTRAVATQKLADNSGVIASFSRALTEGLTVNLSDEEFTDMLGNSIAEIAAASNT
jgi:fructose-bisphosphate aldolase class I